MPRPIAFIVILIGLSLAGGALFAADAAIRDVRIGIDNHFKRGHWAEVTCVIIAGDGPLHGELEVISRDGEGTAAAFVCSKPIELGSAESVELTTLVKFGPPRSGLKLRVRNAQQTLVEADIPDSTLTGQWHPREQTWQQAHRSTSLVIASVGSDCGMTSSVDLLRRSLGDEVVALQLADPELLPLTCDGYDAIDVLVISASAKDPLPKGLTSPRREALRQWLRTGGRIVLVAGDSLNQVFLSEGAWSLPPGGQVVGEGTLSSDTGLRSFADEALELNPAPKLWQLNVPRALVTVSESGSRDQPLIVEYPVGMGRVSLILLDLATSPLAEWAGRGRLLARLINGEELNVEGGYVARGGGSMTHLGYRDMAGQLRMALDQYSGVSPVHFYPVAGALLLYLLLLGPGEYFLLRQAAPRAMHITWFLFPLLIIGFAGGAIALGRSSHGNALRANEVEIVDLDLTAGRQRGMFWTSVFSPQTRSLSLAATPRVALKDAAISDVHLAWQALPGVGLGGVDTELPPRAATGGTPYVVRSGASSTPASIEGLTIPLASSKLFSGHWSGTLAEAKDASSLHRGKILEVEGTFRVVSPVPLKNAYLAFGDWLYRAHDDLVPGANINVANLERKHLEYQFTRRRMLKEADFATPWNQEESDPQRIMEIMMFHGALHGRNYTVLSHRYHDDLDLTHLIHQGYAVLVGRSETPLVELQIDGRPLEESGVRRWTYYRIIYPVAGLE